MALPATLTGARPAITRRAPASSVATGQSSPGTLVSAAGASAIASLGARDLGIQQCHWQGH
ncbi:MAG TPA: hypothetical protein VIL91_09855 [Gaiellaceae bacterium]